MEIIQGYGKDPQIQKISHSMIKVISSEKDNDTYWIVLTWYAQPIAQVSLRWINYDNIEQGYWIMTDFIVRKLRQREGWGRKLFQTVIDFIGTKSLVWYVKTDNIDGQVFFRKMGAIDFGLTVKKSILFGYRQTASST